jgi:hypothetical protein
MATVTKGKTFINGELVTPAALHQMVDSATVTGIANADIAANAAIADTKLAQISTAGKVLPAAVQGTAVITTDSRLSDARTPSSHTHDDRYYTETEIDGKLSGLPVSGHTHAATDITTGTLANARTTATNANTASAIVARDASGNFSAGTITASLTGTASGNAPATGIAPSAITGTAVITTDSRLSDSRTPSSHTHGNITNAGAIGTTSGVPLITGTSGVLQAGSFGTAAGTFCQGNDTRLSNARTPTAHDHSAAEITSGTLANARTTATNANTATAIVARDIAGDFSAGRITSSQTIPRNGSLIFQDALGLDFELRGNSINDKLFLRASGGDILEIDATNGFPVWKFTSLGANFRIGIGTSSPNEAAKLEVSSTTQGFLPPRMTETQRDAITSPPSGLILYNTTFNKLQVRTPTLWVDLH